MYRSFVTCDDPKGVVECGTIRKSKDASQKIEDKLQNHRRDKTTMMPPREEDYPSPASYQLLEVSRGAQKLNQLIDSWSKGLSYESSRGQSKDVAKELLKGALDLQDSLTMLGKLQEASHYVSKLKNKKHKEKVERGRFDDVWCGRTTPSRFGCHDHRFSGDGSSGESIEELRNAIRDGFARQNVLANRCSLAKRMDLDSCVPSTSSSHSTDSFMSQTGLQKKGKAPNLIAKLMGLEDIPLEPLTKAHHRQLDMEGKKLRKAELDKMRKPQPVPNKVDPRRVTLEEILETAHCQGLRRGSSVKELKSHSHQHTEFHSRRKSVDDVHPIVLMKPLRVPCFNPEEDLGPIVRGDGGFDTKMMLRRTRVRQWLDPGSIDRKEVTSKSSRMHFETELEEIPNERIIQEEGAKDHMKVASSPEEKEVRTINQRAGNANKMPRKLEAEKGPVKRHSHEERAKEHKEKEAKKRRDSSPSKADGTNPAAHKQLKEETTDKKVDKVQKVVTSSRKPVERESLKTKNVSKSEEQTKLTSMKLRKPGNGSITTDEHTSQQRTTTRKTITKHTTQTKSYSSKDRKPKEKQGSEHTAATTVAEILECKEEEKRIDVTCEIHSKKKESTITQVNEPSIEEDENVPEFRVEDHCGQSQSTTLSSEYGEDVRSSTKAEDEMTDIIIDFTSYKGENELKTLLLTTPTFINLAEELFHLNLSHPKISPPSTINNQAISDIKISFANEFIQRRSLPDSQMRHPLLLSCMGNPRTPLSIDQLVEEVRSGVETLESYRKVDFDEICVDSLYGILDRDMRCRGVVSGIWDMGWRNGFSVSEVEEAVNDLEKLFVSELIEEVLS
ncbi:uncharacterized protein [Euphorbia lathyris]|uniref:uncharacterized protein n=1 Tax=Euphorbia lathyris TaxID=212925 RepID=UPI003313C4BB